MKWKEHIAIIRTHIDALENEGHLDGCAPAVLGQIEMQNGLESIEEALRNQEFMKGN